jgi:hypothetical protein
MALRRINKELTENLANFRSVKISTGNVWVYCSLYSTSMAIVTIIMQQLSQYPII